MAKVGYAIVTVILVSGLFSFWQEYRVEQTLAALRSLLPQQVQVLRGGIVTRVPARWWTADRASRADKVASCLGGRCPQWASEICEESLNCFDFQIADSDRGQACGDGAARAQCHLVW